MPGPRYPMYEELRWSATAIPLYVHFDKSSFFDQLQMGEDYPVFESIYHQFTNAKFGLRDSFQIEHDPPDQIHVAFHMLPPWVVFIEKPPPTSEALDSYAAVQAEIKSLM